MTANRDTLREGMRETVLQSLETGAPGLSAATRQAIARSIILKVEGRVLAQILDKADSADRMAEENAHLRASLANSGGPCAYCNLPREDWSKCASGFPGCDRADDAMLCPHVGVELATAHLLAAAEARADRLSAEVEALREVLRAVEACMKIVAPSYDEAWYSRTLDMVRTALARAAVKAETEGSDHG